MGDLVQFDYGQLQQMESALKQGAQRLDQCADDLAKIAAGFHGGTFEGQAGQAIAEGIQAQLCKSIKNLGQFYRDMAAHLQQAATEMQQQDAKGKF